MPVRASARPDRVGSTAYGRRCLGVGPSAPSVPVSCAAPFPRARGRPRGDLARPVFWIAGGGTVAIRDGGTPPAPIAEDFGWRRRSCSAASLQETDTDGAGRWRTVSEGCWVKFCLCRYRNGSISGGNGVSQLYTEKSQRRWVRNPISLSVRAISCILNSGCDATLLRAYKRTKPNIGKYCTRMYGRLPGCSQALFRSKFFLEIPIISKEILLFYSIK